MSKKITHQRNERQIRRITALTALLLSILIILIDAVSFQRYRKSLISTEQSQLLTMARTIGTSLEAYLEAEISKIDLCAERADSFHTLDELEASAKKLHSSSKVYRGCLCLSEGTLLFTVGDIGEEARKAAALAGPRTQILGKYLAQTGWYELLVGRTLTVQERPLVLVWTLDLNTVFQKIVRPVKIGQGGYSVVKDSDLAIIMHHAQSQIGMDALYDRQERYPNLDLSSLRDWLQLQREQEEGVGILESYVWDDPKLTPVQRIVAYTTVSILSEKWIVNSTLPSSELSQPLSQMVLIMALLTLAYLAIMLLLVSTLTRTMVQGVAQRREIEYLKEINRGLELIGRQRNEIQHYQRVQSLGMMSSHIAHEFNNYLTPVMLYGEILEGDEQIPEESRDLISEMMKSVCQAARLSRELLDFSRMDAGGHLKALNLAEEVQEALSIIRQLVPKAITFQTQADKAPAWLTGRQGMVQHILMNLCKNAFQAMESSPKKDLTLAYRLLENEATLRVSDTGCGIRKEDFPHLFEPFYTTKGSGQGTGLGLSTVRSLAEQAGGTIQIESTPGEGTTFLLTFPVAPSEESLKVRKEGQEIRRSLCLCRQVGDLAPWKPWLSRQSGVLETTTSETTVVRELMDQEGAYDQLILQQDLPSLTGAELARIIRPRNRQMRIVLLAHEPSEELSWYLDSSILDEVCLPSQEDLGD